MVKDIIDESPVAYAVLSLDKPIVEGMKLKVIDGNQQVTEAENVGKNIQVVKFDISGLSN